MQWKNVPTTLSIQRIGYLPRLNIKVAEICFIWTMFFNLKKTRIKTKVWVSEVNWSGNEIETKFAFLQYSKINICGNPSKIIRIQFFLGTKFWKKGTQLFKKFFSKSICCFNYKSVLNEGKYETSKTYWKFCFLWFGSFLRFFTWD